MSHTAEKLMPTGVSSLPDHALVVLKDGTLVPCQVIGRSAWGPGIIVDSPGWTTSMSVPFERLILP